MVKVYCCLAGESGFEPESVQGPVLFTNGPLFPRRVHREGKSDGEGGVRRQVWWGCPL